MRAMFLNAVRVIAAPLCAILVLGIAAGISAAEDVRSPANQSPSAQEIRSVYSWVMDAYAHQEQRSIVPSALVERLEINGIRALLDTTPAGMSEAERARMLNDYGFLLSKTIDIRSSAYVLRKVVTIAPTRTVAWLNLGDSVRELGDNAKLYSKKTELWTEAAEAFRTYEKLGGKLDAERRQFLTLDPVEALQSGNVCQYVARASGSFSWRAITAYEALLPGGRRVHVRQDGPGHCDPEMAVIEEPDSSETIIAKEPEEAEGGCRDREFWVIPFRDRPYILHRSESILDYVDDIEGHEQCRFSRSVDLELVEDKAPEICGRFMQGDVGEKIGWMPASDIKDSESLDVSAFSGSGTKGWVDGVSVVTISGKSITFAHINVGDFRYGHDWAEIGIIDGQTVSSTAFDRWLDALPRDWGWRKGSDAYLVKMDGTTYVVAEGGGASPHGKGSRMLFRIEPDAVSLVCRVDEVSTYVPLKSSPERN